jgi:hypothetical protein
VNIDLLLFFEKMPEAMPLYEAVEKRICTELADVKIKVQKTQITFSNKHGFAFVSLPFRKVKGRPGVYIILSFGLNRKEDHPRIMQSTEPYPGRWTHHIILQNEDEIDDQIMEWLSEAYHFAMIK